MIDLFQPYIPKGIVEAVSDVLNTRWIGQGPKVEEFEKKFCKHFYKDDAVSVNSGTAALETAYEICGIGPGDEVITTAHTFSATFDQIVALGATPIIPFPLLPTAAIIPAQCVP